MEAIKTPTAFRASVEKPPLCIDLDNTLVKTDTLLESMLLLLKQKPLYVLLLPFWLLKGKSYLKHQIAQRVILDVALLPYHSALLEYLREQWRSGRKILLTTAADASIANQIAKHLGIFHAVLATNGRPNLAGRAKLRQIRKYLGSSEFVYAGNAKVDLPIWRSSKSAIIVNAPNRIVDTVNKFANVSHLFKERNNRVRSFVSAIRPHQWVKNALILIPLGAAHEITNPERLLDAVLAFVAFSLCSSGVYLLNDLLDLEADRRHSSKQQRPFACGDLPVKVGLLAFPLFVVAGIGLSLLLPFHFTMILSLYFVSTLSYSFYIKKIVILDVILLAVLYTLRIIAGGVATDIYISNWLLVFSLFLFLSLALLKRYSELHDIASLAKETDPSRGYSTCDIEQLTSMGSASGYITALVLGLYINSEDVKSLYAHPELLWLICPLILYWISRAWIIARRGAMDDDPVVFAVTDRTSYAVGIVAAIIVVLAVG
jgi:4-hydroxybenzoate polyprenyltransferase